MINSAQTRRNTSGSLNQRKNGCHSDRHGHFALRRRGRPRTRSPFPLNKIDDDDESENEDET